jgi:chromosomal replication initiator protein
MQLRAEVGEATFASWLAPLVLVDIDGDQVTLGVATRFLRDWIASHYAHRVAALWARERSGIEGVRIAIHAGPPQAGESVRQADGDAPRALRDGPAARPLDGALAGLGSPLNGRFTFREFVVGETNELAHAAAQQVAGVDRLPFNPLYLYGGVGLGKTHLLQAAGNAVHLALPDLKVVYVTVETFTNEFIQSIKEKTGHRFKNRYRSADLLLIDDIQFLQGKVETQQELFHTFNALYDANKQMVFSSDRPVSELMALPDRLINRFERGLNVDLHPPSYETRSAIVKRKLEERGLLLDDNIIDLICRNIITNVRDLEKALTRLAAYTELMGRTITLDIAQRELQDFFSKPEHLSISIDSIQRAVSGYYSLTPADLKGKKRTQAIAFPRQVAMFLARSLTKFSTTEVGIEFGGRDHTTVMHACQRVVARMKTDATLETSLQKITNTIRERSVA